jgi:Icc protein
MNPLALSFVHITDHHLRHSEALLTRGYSTAHAFRTVLRDIAEQVGDRADFLVMGGDLVAEGTDAEYETLRAMLDLKVVAPAPGPQLMTAEGLRDFPVYFLPGNHDDRSSFFRHLFRDTPPMPLLNVAFERDGVQFICVDWGIDAKAVAYPEMLDFLARSLQTALPSVILTHHHVAPTGYRWLDDMLADNLGRFWDLLAGRNVLAIFSGHVHATYEVQRRGIPVYGLRATTFQFALQDKELFCLLPPHYRYVSIDNGLLTTRIFEVRL